MSEVDRLSNSGLYPALPIADRKNDKGESSGKRSTTPPSPDKKRDPNSGTPPATPASPRSPPKSIIDDYA